MDSNSLIADYYLLSHRHKDGSWGEMQELPHHSSAEHDQERFWGIRRIFKCKTCEEYATVVMGAEGADTPAK